MQSKQRSCKGQKGGHRKQVGILEQMDMFGASLPVFNLSGETQVRTKTGGCLSLMFMAIFLAYGAVKFGQMMSKHNPFISEITEINFFDIETKLDLNEIKFRMAFSVEGFLDKEIKDDPRYVKYIVRMVGKRNNVGVQEMIPFHKCTDDDWNKFYEPAKGMKD